MDMQKVLSAFFLFSITFFSTTSYVVAQTTTSTSSPETVATTSEPVVTPPINPQPVFSSVPETELPEAKRKRVINLAANMSNRIEAAARRLGNIAGRLETRLYKIETETIDLDEALLYVAEAQQGTTDVFNTMEKIDEAVFASVTSETPRASWQEVKKIYQVAQSDLDAAKQALETAIVLTKEAINNPKPAATSSTVISEE